MKKRKLKASDEDPYLGYFQNCRILLRRPSAPESNRRGPLAQNRSGGEQRGGEAGLVPARVSHDAWFRCTPPHRAMSRPHSPGLAAGV